MTMITPQVIMTIAGAVIMLVQMLKQAGMHGERAKYSSLVCSILGVALWAWQNDVLHRPYVFELFAAIVTVAGMASGLYSFGKTSTPALSGIVAGALEDTPSAVADAAVGKAAIHEAAKAELDVKKKVDGLT